MVWEENPETIRSGHGEIGSFDPKSFRTIDITEGIQAVIGCPKGSFENGKCKVGTSVQSYLFSKPKFTMKTAKAWFKEHEGAKKEEEEMDEKLSWVQEIEQAFRAMDDKERFVAISTWTEEQLTEKIAELQKQLDGLWTKPPEPEDIEKEKKRARLSAEIEAYKQALAELIKKKVQGENIKTSNWKASFNYSAGTMMAELLPDFKTPNINGFYLHPSLKEKLIAKLNSGTVFLRDAHSRAIKDIIGIVKRGIESRDGKIHIEADVENPEVDKVLKKYKDKMGVSLGGSGVGYCSECNKRVMGMTRCPNHPKASIVVKEFDLKEVSLTDQPAWETSRVEDYV